MKYQQLGKSSLQISRIGFGSMSVNQDKEQLIHHAIELGINYFDTADLYDKGENEIILGKALKEKRHQVVLATKAGNQWRTDGSGWDWNPRKEYILTAAEESLKRLQTDYIDLYQLHGGTLQDPVDETIEAFEQLVQEGKIRYYGLSSIRPAVIREWVNRSNIISVMMQYSLLDRRAEETSLELLQHQNIGVLARGSVAQGLLVNKPPKKYLNYTEEEVKGAAAAVQALSGNIKTAAQTAINFVLAHSAITSAVVGVSTRKQLEDVVATIAVPGLTQKEREVLQSSIPVNFYEEHR